MALGLTGVPSSVGGPFTGKVTSTAITRLGLSGVPRARFQDIAKEPAEARGSTQISTLGLGAFSRPVWGDLSKTVVSTTYYDYSTDALTFTENSYSVLQDKVIDYTGVEVVPTTYDYEIIQGGQTLSYSVDALTFTEYSYNVEQDDPANTVVRYDPVPLTFTAYDYAVVQQRLVSYSNTPNVSFTEYAYDVIPGVLGEQTLSNADIYAIFNNYKIDGYSLHELMAGMAAMLMGESENADKQGTATYKSVRGDGTVRVAGVTDGRGNRSAVTRTLR